MPPPPLQARLTYRDLMACALAVVLAALVYLNALHNPFVYDDQRLIVSNQSLQHLTDLRAIVLHEVTRPLVNFSYALDYTIWGRTPFGFHLTSVLRHLLNVVLVYLLAWRVTDDRSRRGPAAVDQPSPGVVAFSTAVLFAVHPMMTEAVGYVAGRAEVICATFFLTAVLAMRWWMIGGRVGWLVASIVAWMLALASKEVAVMFPFVILAYDRLVCPGSNEDRRWRLLHLHLPFYVVAVIAVVVRLVVFTQLENATGVKVIWAYALAEVDVVRRYLMLLLMFTPNGQAVFHAVPIIGSVLTMSALLAIGTLAFLVSLVVVLYRAGRPAASFGLLWFVLLLVPSAALVVFDRGEPMAERRVYLASVGLFIALSTGIGWLSVRFGQSRPVLRWTFRVTVALAVLSLAGHTVIRNAVWSSPVSLWADAAEKAPDHWYPALLLGESLHAAGRHSEAVAAFRRSIQLRPGEAGTYGRAGICLVELDRLDEAKGMFESMRKIDPWAPDGTNGLGTVALARGQIDLARLEFLETLQNDPLNVRARVGLVAVEERSGHPAEARTRCQEIQQLAPDIPESDDCLRVSRDSAAPSGSGGR